MRSKFIEDFKSITITTDGITLSYDVVHNTRKNIEILDVTLIDGVTKERFIANVTPSLTDSTNKFTVQFDKAYPAGSFIAIIK